MVTPTVRNVTLLVLVLATVAHSAPPKKFPFGKARETEPEPEQPANDVVASSEQSSSSSSREQPVEAGSEETLEKKQAKAAQYAYDTSVNDTINDHAIMRQEERNGLSLKGMYSYSDGFFRRTVHYEADEKGYRVVKELNVPIGNGPQIDPNGKADVSSSLAGSYSITSDDIAKPQRKEVPASEEVASSDEAPSHDEPDAPEVDAEETEKEVASGEHQKKNN